MIAYLETDPTANDAIDFAVDWLANNENEHVDEDDMSMKVVVVARYDLKMTAGKLAAQVGHAIHSLCRESDEELIEEWEDEDSCSKIVVLGVNDHAGMLDVIARAEALGLGVFPIEDAGRTEVEPGSLTVAAIGPSYEQFINAVTGSLRPYKEPKPVIPQPKPSIPTPPPEPIIEPYEIYLAFPRIPSPHHNPGSCNGNRVLNLPRRVPAPTAD